MSDSGLLFLGSIAVRTLIVLLVLLVGVRLFGKRQLGGMNIYDLVTVLLLANAVQNAMTKGSGMLTVGLVSAGVLLLVDALLGRLFARHPSLETRVIGSPTIVVQDGQLQRANLRHEGVTEEEVLAAVRAYGLDGLQAVKLAVLEVDGSISVVPRDRQSPALPGNATSEPANPSAG